MGHAQDRPSMEGVPSTQSGQHPDHGGPRESLAAQLLGAMLLWCSLYSSFIHRQTVDDGSLLYACHCSGTIELWDMRFSPAPIPSRTLVLPEDCHPVESA